MTQSYEQAIELLAKYEDTKTARCILRKEILRMEQSTDFDPRKEELSCIALFFAIVCVIGGVWL